MKICVYHKQERKFIDTAHYLSKKQIDADFKIKDMFILELLEETLKGYRQAISNLGGKLEFFSCKELRDYSREKDDEIDFIKFCSQHIDQLRRENRNGTANNQRTVRNSLIDYFKRSSVAIIEINSNMFFTYDRYLRTERNLTRINQFGRKVHERKGLVSSGVYNHMRDLRTLFNAACKFYNNEDLGLYKIKHYPFKKYKIGSAPLTRKRNISVEQVMTIRNCKVKEGSRAELARDLFMLSFYLCGMNAVDFYHLNEANPACERLEYHRSKTTINTLQCIANLQLINKTVFQDETSG